jgi:hypothetical protein
VLTGWADGVDGEEVGAVFEVLGTEEEAHLARLRYMLSALEGRCARGGQDMTVHSPLGIRGLVAGTREGDRESESRAWGS